MRLTEEQREQLLKMAEDGASNERLAKKFHLSTKTIIKYKKGRHKLVRDRDAKGRFRGVTELRLANSQAVASASEASALLDMLRDAQMEIIRLRLALAKKSRGEERAE